MIAKLEFVLLHLQVISLSKPITVRSNSPPLLFLVSYSLDGRRRVWSKRTRPTLNELLNHPIQGTNATIIKRAIALLDSSLLAKVPQVKLILVVHDEIVLEVPRTLADRVARSLSDYAIAAAQPILAPIPTEVEVKVLDSWGDR